MSQRASVDADLLALAPMRRAWPVMGTVASLHLYCEPERLDAAEAAADAVAASLAWAEAVFSVFRPDSQIGEVNRGLRSLFDCDREVTDVLDACTWLEHASGGAFSAHGSAGTIDPTGFVKGWAAERASAALLDAGFTRWCLNVGGDAIVHADPATDPAWRIGLVDPFDRTKVRASIDLHCGALATSGTTERGLHLLDPRTGTPATHWVSLTVIGSSLTWADAFATTACALGAAGPAWVAQFEDYEVIAISADGTIERRTNSGAVVPVGV